MSDDAIGDDIDTADPDHNSWTGRIFKLSVSPKFGSFFGN